MEFAPDVDHAMKGLESEVLQEIISFVQLWQTIKVLISMHVNYEFANPNEDPQRNFEADLKAPFTTFSYLNDKIDLVGYWPTAHSIAERLIQNNVNFIREKSGLVLADIVSLEVRIVQCNPFAGAAYNKLPAFIENKNAVVNVQNFDKRCFGYAMLATMLNIQIDPERVKNYKEEYFAEYKLDSLDYYIIPTPKNINDISKMLQINISVIGLYTEVGRGRYPMITTKNHFDRKVILLYWKEHFAWISNISRFLSDLSTVKHTLYWCTQCLHRSNNEFLLNKHELLCCREDMSSVLHLMPDENSFITFQNVKYQTQAPFVIYADLESLLHPIDIQCGKTHRS